MCCPWIDVLEYYIRPIPLNNSPLLKSYGLGGSYRVPVLSRPWYIRLNGGFYFTIRRLSDRVGSNIGLWISVALWVFPKTAQFIQICVFGLAPFLHMLYTIKSQLRFVETIIPFTALRGSRIRSDGTGVFYTLPLENFKGYRRISSLVLKMWFLRVTNLSIFRFQGFFLTPNSEDFRADWKSRKFVQIGLDGGWWLVSENPEITCQLQSALKSSLFGVTRADWCCWKNIFEIFDFFKSSYFSTSAIWIRFWISEQIFKIPEIVKIELRSNFCRLRQARYVLFTSPGGLLRKLVYLLCLSVPANIRFEWDFQKIWYFGGFVGYPKSDPDCWRGKVRTFTKNKNIKNDFPAAPTRSRNSQ